VQNRNNPKRYGENMRRSLTVTPENDKKILLTKGRFLTGEAPLDIDYTTMVNILIELGHKLITSAWSTGEEPKVTLDKQEIIEAFKKYTYNSELKEEAVGDLVAEIIFKKFIEQTGAMHSITNKQNPTQELPPQQCPPPPKNAEYVS
jgi:hypothetical protein